MGQRLDRDAGSERGIKNKKTLLRKIPPAAFWLYDVKNEHWKEPWRPKPLFSVWGNQESEPSELIIGSRAGGVPWPHRASIHSHLTRPHPCSSVADAQLQCPYCFHWDGSKQKGIRLTRKSEKNFWPFRRDISTAFTNTGIKSTLWQIAWKIRRQTEKSSHYFNKF